MNIEIKNKLTSVVLLSIETDDLRDANLHSADLRGADLSWIDLSGADLSEADLSDANLLGANLSDANLHRADLRDANLSEANLIGADLSGADLSGADLSEADLSGADLSLANLIGVDLKFFKIDFFDILLRSIKEIPKLRQSLVDGKVDGSCYQGKCACLIGTIANIRGVDYLELGNGLNTNSSRPAEQWFSMIKPEHTPENNQPSKLAVEWIDEFLSLLKLAS